MALAVTLPTPGIFSTTTGPYATASFTPTGSAGILVGAFISDSTKPTIDTPTWLDGAWAEEAYEPHSTLGVALIVWSGKAVSSPGADTLTVTGTTSPLGCCLITVQVTGQDTSDYVLQPESAEVSSATSISLTLDSALAGSDSACLGFFAHTTNEAHAPAGSETEPAGADNGHNSPTRRMSMQYEVNDTTSGVTWATSDRGVGAIMEIKAAAGGTSHTAEPDDTLSLADLLARATVTARSVPDTLSIADSAVRELQYARAIPDTLSLADLADPQLLAPSAVVREIRLRL